MKRIKAVITKEFFHIFRDPRSLVMFVAPVIQTIILGYVVTTDIKHIPVQVVNLSESRTAGRIISRMRSSLLFEVKKVSRQPEDYVEAFKRGEVRAIIILRDGADRKRRPLHYPEIQILMDGMDSNTAVIEVYPGGHPEERDGVSVGEPDPDPVQS